MKHIDFSLLKPSWLGSGIQKYKAFQNNSQNKPLFAILAYDGFFDFYITNNQQIVYFHQIVAFYFCGGRLALNNGFVSARGVHEVHHLDGNTFNNSPSNLQYVDNNTHIIITKHQRSIGKNAKYLKAFKSDFNTSDVQVWNKKGSPVKRKAHWITSIIAKTVCNTASANNVPVNYSFFSFWFNRILSFINAGFDSTLVPTHIIYF